MTAYIAKRILLMLPTLFGVLLLTFMVTQFVPGGPVEQYIAEARRGAGTAGDAGGYRGGQGVDPKKIEQIKALYGFDKPPAERFWQMLKQFAQFDLGRSFFQNKDVWQLIKEKLPVSISLGLWTFFISYLIAVPLGVAKAVRAGSRFDLVTTLIVLVGYAKSINANLFDGNMASLPLLIYQELANPEAAGRERVWGAALTLILLIALLYGAAAVVNKLLTRNR